MAAMTDIVWVFIAIAGLFYGGLLLKPLIKSSLCTICLAVSLTWITLFILRQFGWFDNNLILAILLGQSIVGGYYLWERSVRKDRLIFRLPVLLTLTLVAWSGLRLELNLALLGVVAAVWLLHSLLYFYRSKPRIKTLFDKIIACCSRW